jgi:hypothetical protein
VSKQDLTIRLVAACLVAFAATYFLLRLHRMTRDSNDAPQAANREIGSLGQSTASHRGEGQGNGVPAEVLSVSGAASSAATQHRAEGSARPHSEISAGELLAAVLSVPRGGPSSPRHQFVSETVDPYWSNGAETEIREYLDRHLHANEVELENVECRKSICELQIVPVSGSGFNAPDVAWQLLPAMSSEEWWSAYQLTGEPSVTIVRFNDSRPVVIAYVSRAGSAGK